MDYDVIIVGGGMVGATLACALGQARFRVAVVEAAQADVAWPRPEYDIRVSALTRASQRIFDALGAWEGMCARRATPYRAMHVWDATGDGSIHFDAAAIGEPDLGHIVENSVILGALLERMAHLETVELICPAQLASLAVDAAGVSLYLGERTLRAPLVVGADGARSWVREQAGIDTTGWSYEQSAVTATVTTSRHHGHTARQRFMPDGPLAFLPMPEGRSSIVWSTRPENAEALVAMPPAEFLDALQQSFGDNLGRMEAVGPRGAFPLLLRHANAYVRERIALTGNAAHAIHPLAGQGLNLGTLDAAALAEVLEAARARGEDIGRFKVLRRYERWRKGDNVAVMAAMDGFKRLFGNDIAPLRLVRNLGLTLADAAAPMKNLMVRRAMGLTGDLPALARVGSGRTERAG